VTEEVADAGLGRVTAWIVERLWLPLAGVAAVLALAGWRAQVAPGPPRVGGSVIVGEQMRRSRTIDAADVLIVGDSSGLVGIDPVELGHRLDRTVRSLSVIGPVRGSGFIRLLRSYLGRGHAPEAIVLAIHPFSLMTAWKPGQGVDLAEVVRSDRWPSPPLVEGAKSYLDETVLRGWLDEPLPGAWGEYYGNAASLRRFLWRQHGGLVDPAPPLAPLPERGVAVKYLLHADGRRSLRRMRELLDGVDAKRVFVALTPVPDYLDREDPRATRDRFLAEILAALGLPDSQGLHLPGTMATGEMTGPTHVSALGRRKLTEHVADALASALERG